MDKKNDKKPILPKRVNYSRILRDFSMLIILIFMVIVFSIIQPAFLSGRNILNIMTQISYIGLIALGVTMVIIALGIDLSSGSVLALAAVVAASFAQSSDWEVLKYPGLQDLPFVVPLLAGMLVGTICGAINGTIIAKTGIPPFIATLGMMTAARGLALIYSNGRPISGLHDAYCFIGGGKIGPIPFPVIILVVMALISHTMLKHTKFGKYNYAIGGNEQAARVSGINITKYKILIYTYAGMLAGLAGVVLSSRVSSGQPGFGNMYELDAIASAVIGGTSLNGGIGTIPGTLVGAMILGVLNNGLVLMNVDANWQQVVKGVIIIGAVVMDVRKNRLK
ncbi:MAG: ABC transporter permease [Spirochaetes bacterium]|nr:ABC transporter permease [Spirochaetota bacterium]